MVSDAAEKLHEESIVIDGTCPLLADEQYVDWYIEGGCNVVTPTVGANFSAEIALKIIGRLYEYVRNRDDLMFVHKASDVQKAFDSDKLGLVMHFQGTGPIAEDLNRINLFQKLGVGIIQLTYNVEDFVGYGAQVADKGLKPFGHELIKRCNELGVIVDCSHTGHRTSMEAIEVASRPVILSHANPKALFATETDRNVSDELIQAIAATGGLTGVTGFPGFLGGGPKPSLDVFLDHVEHLVTVGGIDHVALGIDYYLGQWPVVDGEKAERAYRREVESGRWRAGDYPPPPHIYPAGIETPRTLQVITDGLLRRGHSDLDVKKILGLNLMRVYESVWG